MNRANDHLAGYLGDFADDLTDEQIDRLEATAEQIAGRYHPDMTDERMAALNAAGMVAFGDSTLGALADEWRAARERERAAMAALTGAILYASGEMSQAEIVTATQVNRMTIRKALGL